MKQGLVNIYQDMHVSVNVYLLVKAEIHTKLGNKLVPCCQN